MIAEVKDVNDNINNDNILLPGEDEIKEMNKEYSLAFVRKEYADKKSAPVGILCKKPSICTHNYDNIARCYFLQRDILLSLSFLIGKAPSHFVKCTIKNIINIKECAKDQLYALYRKGTGCSLNYSPNIIDRLNFQSLLTEIIYMQTTLLARLEDIRGICRIINAEHSATLMLHSIKQC